MAFDALLYLLQRLVGIVHLHFADGRSTVSKEPFGEIVVFSLDPISLVLPTDVVETPH